MIYLQLKTPFSPGSYDPGASYPHAFITVFNLNSLAQVIELRYEYGNFDPSDGWTTGKASMTQVAHITNDDFNTAVSAMPDADSQDSVLMSAARQAYDYLVGTNKLSGEVTEGTISTTPPATTAAPSS